MRFKGKKIGRNEPCPCGSGRKFKRCHGRISSQTETDSSPACPAFLRKAQARQMQREQQQGLGKPIISAESSGQRLVAVGSQLHYSPNWKTFHDFLFDYIKKVLGPEWGTAELKKPEDKRHPILNWYSGLIKLQTEQSKDSAEIRSAPMNGAVAAYLHLAYDLYCLSHNAEIQTELIHRLKHLDQFAGAHYETYVAAALLRAGFEIKFEDEADRDRSHCEFTAKSLRTGCRYSVEAKHREGADDPGSSSVKFRHGRRLQRALRKRADHARVIFMDINIPDAHDNKNTQAILEQSISDIRRFEGRSDHNGNPLPNAYLILTNRPFQHDPERTDHRCTVIGEGFQIFDFKHDTAFGSLREAIESREKHLDMFQLLDSMRLHSEVPSTFDGENPELHFQERHQSLQIGEKYLVDNPDGIERPSTLTTATIDESTGYAICAFHHEESGTAWLGRVPLTDTELRGYRKHPETFFGMVQSVPKKVSSPLEMYNFFYGAYSKTPKAKLLEFLKNAPDIDELRSLSQDELAKIFCERCVASAMQKSQLT